MCVAASWARRGQRPRLRKAMCTSTYDVSNAFGLIFQSITSPRASVIERLFLLKTKQPEFSWTSGVQLTHVMVGLSGDMSSCPIMFISFAELKRMGSPRLSSWYYGKVIPAERLKRLVSRGHRPRLQRCGNANFLITSCVPIKATWKSGITSGITLSALAWSLMQTNGITPARSKR
jgi:hypothetical protein